MKTKELNDLSKKYIFDNICQYDGQNMLELGYTEEFTLKHLLACFTSEYVCEAHLKRYGTIQNCFKEWLQGLPSVFTVDFENYKILELYCKWYNLKIEDLTESRQQKILNNWFNFISMKTFRLFKLAKILH